MYTILLALFGGELREWIRRDIWTLNRLKVGIQGNESLSLGFVR
jgi:hypothetical protein